MKDQNVSREALFNEVKGSLFEFLVGKSLATHLGLELEFIRSIDHNYLNVLTQQDRMVRQFYPEMLGFLQVVTESSVDLIQRKLGPFTRAPRLLGKFVSNEHEGDLLLETAATSIPLSLKLNKKNAFVNTKSGGIKSFFTQYFPFIDPSVQQKFNQLVDLEFNRMSLDLHEHKGLTFSGNYQEWVRQGFSEHPGELSEGERSILRTYYARIAKALHQILSEAEARHPEEFRKSLPPLMGFSSEAIVQVICFHEFKGSTEPEVELHSYGEIAAVLGEAKVAPFADIASVEVSTEKWSLQIRVKPMNKFTTTAIKINCSVKLRS